MARLFLQAAALVLPSNLLLATASSAGDDLSLLQGRVQTQLVEINPALLQTQASHSEKSSVQSFCGDRDGFVSEWADEFDGEKLDTSVWKIIDSKGRETGPQTSVVAGLEVTACRTASCREENVFLQDGKLHLTSEKNEASSEYFTGAITTKGQKTWADGPAYRMCISAKLPGTPGPQGRGVWPAHWMLPDNGISDACLDEGEMDIMEMVNSDGGSYATFHWMSSWPQQKCASFDAYHQSAHALTRMPSDWNSAFHEYAVERSQDYIAFAVDGRVVLNVSAADANTQLSHTPFFLILNTAIGGGWPGEPGPETQFPLEHVVDYVRVSRRKEAAAGSAKQDRAALRGALAFTQISTEVRMESTQDVADDSPRPPLSLA